MTPTVDTPRVIPRAILQASLGALRDALGVPLVSASSSEGPLSGLRLDDPWVNPKVDV